MAVLSNAPYPIVVSAFVNLFNLISVSFVHPANALLPIVVKLWQSINSTVVKLSWSINFWSAMLPIELPERISVCKLVQSDNAGTDVIFVPPRSNVTNFEQKLKFALVMPLPLTSAETNVVVQYEKFKYVNAEQPHTALSPKTSRELV